MTLTFSIIGSPALVVAKGFGASLAAHQLGTRIASIELGIVGASADEPSHLPPGRVRAAERSGVS